MIRIRERIALLTRPESRDRGLSLTELLVAMTIFAFLLAMVAGFMVSASRALTTNKAIDSSNRAAQNGMDEITRILRGAETNAVSGQSVDDAAFVTAGINTVTLYSYVNLNSSAATPVRVMFFVDSASNLVEWKWAATASGDFFTFPSNATCASSCTSRIVAAQVVTPANGGPNLFSYLDSTGTPLSTTAGLVPAGFVKSIAAIQVSLQIGASSASNQSTLLTNSVGLPNLNVARTN